MIERLRSPRVESCCPLELPDSVERSLQASVDDPELDVRRGRRRIARGGAAERVLGLRVAFGRRQGDP
jgi:hypothetical protein